MFKVLLDKEKEMLLPQRFFLTTGMVILSVTLAGREPNGSDSLTAVRDFEEAVNNLMRAKRTQIPDADVSSFDDRARIAVGAAVSSFCRYPHVPPLQLRETSDANLVEFVLSAFIGDLAGVLSTTSVDSAAEPVDLRLSQAMRLYPICEKPGKLELLYMSQIFAFASVGAPEGLQEQLVVHAAALGRDGRKWELLPLAAAFSAMDWVPPDSLDLSAHRHFAMFRMLERQFLSTRSSALKIVERRADVDAAGQSDAKEEE